MRYLLLATEGNLRTLSRAPLTSRSSGKDRPCRLGAIFWSLNTWETKKIIHDSTRHSLNKVMIHNFTHKKYASVLISKKNEKQVNQWSKVIKMSSCLISISLLQMKYMMRIKQKFYGSKIQYSLVYNTFFQQKFDQKLGVLVIRRIKI